MAARGGENGGQRLSARRSKSRDRSGADLRDGGEKDEDPRDSEDYTGVSSEFNALCQAQFEVVSSLLNATRCVLYFRHEDPKSTGLEFVPAAVYPEKQRVWVVGEGPGGLPSQGALQLPGFIEASSLLPNYPMMPGGGDGNGRGFLMADGGLSMPLEYGGVVMGMVAVWRAAGGKGGARGEGGAKDEGGGEAEWTKAEREQIANIATVLAVAMVLDQRRLWEEAVQASSLRIMLSETLHQVKNSLSAVRMFGKLLLRRLPNDDQMNRELAKDILIQSDRLVDLLLPIDATVRASAPSLPASRAGRLALPPRAKPAAGRGREQKGAPREDSAKARRGGAGGDGLEEAVQELRVEQQQAAVVSRGKGNAGGWCDASEAIAPVVSAGQAIAEFDEVSFNAILDPGAPRVIADPRVLSEAVSNVLDNALKYVLIRGGASPDVKPAVCLTVRRGEGVGPRGGKLVGLEIVVEDNGKGVAPDDLDLICTRGFRGRSPEVEKIEGSGLGLHITDHLVRAMGGTLELENVAPQGLRVRIFLPKGGKKKST